MTPRQADATTRTSPDMFRERLDNMLSQRHALYRLVNLIEWPVFDKEFGARYCPDNGCPGKPVGLLYVKHCYGLSDEEVVSGWVENPYWQYFCGEVYFQHEAPIDPSSLTRFRQRIGESGCERILQVTVKAGERSGTVMPGSTGGYGARRSGYGRIWVGWYGILSVRRRTVRRGRRSLLRSWRQPDACWHSGSRIKTSSTVCLRRRWNVSAREAV